MLKPGVPIIILQKQTIITVFDVSAKYIIYSIVETVKVKANNLKPFDFWGYLLTEIPKHTDDRNLKTQRKNDMAAKVA